MTVTVRYDVTFDVVECYKCGVMFGITHDLNNNLQKNHNQSFYCPNGHGQVYAGETEAEKYRRLLSEEKSRHANTQLELMMKDKQVTKLKKRVSNGVCPCCHRTITQLARHMKSKHPDYVEESK